MSKLKTVKVKPETFNKLAERAGWIHTMDEVINALLKRAKTTSCDVSGA